MFKKWNINDTPEITIPEMNDNLDAIENALKVAELENLIVNGDFSDGVVGWVLNGFLFNEGVFTNQQISYPTIFQDTHEVSDSYLYSYCEFIPLEKIKGQLCLRGSISTGGYQIFEIFNVDKNIKSVLSGVVKPDETQVGKIRAGLAFTLPQNLDGIAFKEAKFILINLTQVFGAGNEPSKEFCDTIMEVVGWFDGKYDLTIQEMFIIVAKWSQAQNINQIMTLPNFDETE